MTLEPVRLDDLTWDGMVTLIRNQIPAESRGAWTLHAPVDPGITLLELFAWLLEQRLWRMDQIPDALTGAIFRLLDVEGPRPARPAATVMAFGAIDDAFGASSQDSRAPLVPAGTELARDARGELVFTLEEDVTVLPVARVGLEIGGQDRTADLVARAGVELLPAGGGPGEASIVLWISPGAAPPAGTWITLLLVLDTPSAIRSQWSPEAAEGVAPPAELTWSYERAGTLAPFSEVQDGTGGLRRSGIVRLAWPREWSGGARLPAGRVEPVPRRIVVRTEQALFSFPPRLLELEANVGVARHVRRVEAGGRIREDVEAQAAAWRSLPGQALRLPGAQGLLLDDPATVRLTIRERDRREHEWEATGDFTFLSPQDRRFVVDRETGELRFGDGLTGRIPVVDRTGIQPAPPVGSVAPVAPVALVAPVESGASQENGIDVGGPGDGRRIGAGAVARLVALRYQLGGGVAGNVGSNLMWRLGGAEAGRIVARNVVPGEGGRESETIEASRERVEAELRRPTRTVTAADYETLVRATPGVAIERVHVGVGRHPSFPCDRVPGAVTLSLVPAIPSSGDEDPVVRAPQPDPGALRAVRAWLEPRRLIGTELFVVGPEYRRVRLRVTASGPLADPARLRALLERALGRYLHPLVGGDGGDGWPFGGVLRPSALLRRAQEAARAQGTVTAIAIGLDGAPPTEECRDLPIESHQLVVLDELTLRVSSQLASAGGLP